ncbi:MAG: DUF4252 domain-containing protein [Saprospiraceae bacterium]|jgi:hypothetical protein|nr:DUF4252 domain-containing protein [Saprospiraceae bacterium]MBK6477873.1 DUF4252 domain-containing protein [Saprospiraceae bacterium]MBK6816253.1 DUF4252 domain-containing protein [Saprospiraceae bacterium]MBK7370364.1 DUF4252 domain-containing protein [Saprospiraceae bacterium]MBK7438073.1 DUF4252 domain-containing protein [Saprospiraceae bacterium]
MKNLLILLFSLFTGSLVAQADAVTKFFKSYVDDDRFSTVYISPKMFQLVSKIKINDMDADLQQLLKNIQGLHILSTHVSPKTFYKEAVSKINTKEYEELMKVRDEGEDVLFLTKTDATGNKITELLMLVGGEDEFSLISFVGDLDLEKIGRLGKSLNIDGSEHLEKLKKN